MNVNSSPLGLSTMPNPGGSSYIRPKPAKNIDGMIRILEERGLKITDGERLRRALFNCNYYRLSGYFRAFQVDPANGDNKFRPGTRDVDFLTPYALDEQLRSIVLKGTARIEVTLRSRFAYLIANDGGAYSYMDPDSYIGGRKAGMRDHLLDNMAKWLSMSNEVCIRHYRRDDRPIPLWAAVEAMPFDTFSKILSLHSDTKALRALYKSVNLHTSLATSAAIVHSIVYLRNLCSHHSRLWHREMVITPPMVREISASFPRIPMMPKSVATSLNTLMYLADHINDGLEYSSEVCTFLGSDDKYAEGIIHPLHWE